MPFTTLGNKPYGTPDLIQFSVYGFQGGLNIKSQPQELADSDLSQALNVYLRSDGGVEMRKGYNLRNTSLGSLGGIIGLADFYQEIVNGVPVTPVRKNVLAQAGGSLYKYDSGSAIPLSGANALGGSALPWSVQQAFDSTHSFSTPNPPILTQVAGTMAAGTYTYQITATTASGESLPSTPLSITTTTASAVHIVVNTLPGALSYKIYGRGPGVTQYMTTVSTGSANYTDNGTITPSGALPTTNTAGIAPSDVLVICTGSGGPYIWDGFTVYTPTAWSSISGARWVTQVNNILWFGGIQSQPNLMQGTALGDPEGVNGGLPGYATFTFSGPITGLGILGEGPQAAVAVGLQKGMSLVSGTSPGNYYEQDVPSEDGCAAGRCMITFNGTLYWLGRQGVYSFDGATAPTILSVKVEPYILQDPLYTDFSMKGDRTTYFAFEYNNRYHLVYDSSGTGTLNTILCLDLTTSGWTILQLTTAISSACLLNAPTDPAPESCIIGDSTTTTAYNWDVYATDGAPTPTYNCYDAYGTASQSYFYSTFTTKFFKVGLPGTPKRLMRFYPEFFTANVFYGSAIVTNDYGTEVSTTAVSVQSGTGSLWDVSMWNASIWAGTGRTFFGAPASRIDTNITGEAFAFSIATCAPGAPVPIGFINSNWTFQGVTGAFSQGGQP